MPLSSSRCVAQRACLRTAMGCGSRPLSKSRAPTPAACSRSHRSPSSGCRLHPFPACAPPSSRLRPHFAVVEVCASYDSLLGPGDTHCSHQAARVCIAHFDKPTAVPAAVVLHALLSHIWHKPVSRAVCCRHGNRAPRSLSTGWSTTGAALPHLARLPAGKGLGHAGALTRLFVGAVQPSKCMLRDPLQWASQCFHLPRIVCSPSSPGCLPCMCMLS